MGFMDRLLTAPPRHDGAVVVDQRVGSLHPDDDRDVGDEPGASYGAQIGSDDRHVHSLDTQRQAAENVATELATETAVPMLRVQAAANDNFYAETFTLQPGEVAMILPRDEWRETAEVFNQSAAGGAKVALCATKRDADNGSKNFPPARGVQVVPGGQVARKMTHAAPVFAVCDPGAAAAAVLDVIAERRHTPRP